MGHERSSAARSTAPLPLVRMGGRWPGHWTSSTALPQESPVLYTLLVIIVAIVLAVIVLNAVRSGGRSV